MLPTLDEEMHDLNGATVFSKLDLNLAIISCCCTLTRGTLRNSLLILANIQVQVALFGHQRCCLKVSECDRLSH